jgi:deoxyguanosine kinase
VLKGKFLPEEFEKNDLLTMFYLEPKKYAYLTELSFLIDRFSAITDALKSKTPFIIADYSIYKCLYFAKVNLKGKEYRQFLGHFRLIEEQLTRPDLIISLEAETSVLKRNILSRGRNYETGIEELYLKKLERAYGEGWKQFPELKKESLKVKYYNRRLTPRLINQVKKLLKEYTQNA